ncbi:alkyl hydroperoxide reductase/ Thiol specific antioxidant/ Mal allergen [Halorhabdus utahensis DSM 12940]|uniref:Peroxiredoxin n=1 Tax=Halorhabdus utahensis (strain DSM 12940 / JCM 11049 / AX-2) TaxID=519442 RepID=C7NRP4_HALUD|nr:peroxiredoxin [Halorhabdus utahensis]ACV11980.1 alkyl hydroperoxide reductase/ Thiol specific antioxidant/ Mal allergen [Halorhabdus utahensis DSM 12940]
MESETDDASGIPLIGDEFPHLAVETTHGEIDLPDDYAGEWVVLFSHPGDFTPVCTTEFVAFEDRREEFEQRDANLIGLSVDRVHSHLKWVDWIEEEIGVEIGFPIIADESGRVGEQLGMIQSGAGTSTVRAVFVVDPDGVVRQVLYYPEEIGRNIDEILRSLDALQKSDDEGVATPANWPENDRFDDRVLLPPPGSRGAVEQRESEADDEGYEQYDWWFTLSEQ